MSKISSILWFCLRVYENTDASPIDIKEAYQKAKDMHEQEVRNAFLQGFIEGSYKNSDLYNPTKVKWHNSKHYYNETFANDTP
jgi:hypothetical protein